MLALQLPKEPRPIAAAIVFVVTVALALWFVFAMQTPQGRKELLRWLRHAPGRLGDSLIRALSPVNWWRAARRRPRVWAGAAGALMLLAVGATVAYRSSPRIRLGVAFAQVSDRAEGPAHWGLIIREGRPAVPFLISQFTAGETREQRDLNRRLDAVLRLTLEWLRWRQPFSAAPPPPAPAGRPTWQLWWEDNTPRIPELVRDDESYERWRRERRAP